MEMERALGIKSYSFIRAVFVIFQALPGSDFSDRIVPILLVSPELQAVSKMLLLGIAGKITVINC